MTRTLARSAAALAALLALSCGGSSTPPDPTYTLEVRYRPNVEAMPPSERAVLTEAVDKAAGRIRAMVTAGLVPVRVSGFDCEGTTETVRIDETVHGLVVLVSYVQLGSSGTLASSGPCIVRRHGKLPLVSVVQFNAGSLNIQNAVSSGNSQLLETVAVHELFHALGFGTVWEDFPGIVTGTDDPVFRGSRAVAAAKEMAHAPASWVGIPVENLGFQGTTGAHWRESELVDELMTGFVNEAGLNPLSAASIASLGDLGYHIDLGQADVPAYIVPGMALRALAEDTGLSFGDDVIRTRPSVVDETVAVP